MKNKYIYNKLNKLSNYLKIKNHLKESNYLNLIVKESFFGKGCAPGKAVSEYEDYDYEGVRLYELSEEKELNTYYQDGRFWYKNLTIYPDSSPKPSVHIKDIPLPEHEGKEYGVRRIEFTCLDDASYGECPYASIDSYTTSDEFEDNLTQNPETGSVMLHTTNVFLEFPYVKTESGTFYSCPWSHRKKYDDCMNNHLSEFGNRVNPGARKPNTILTP